MELNYEEDIRIDETALDVEWLDQPSLMMKYARHQAEMLRAEEEAKENLEIVQSELDKEVRNDPEGFGITTKLTEAGVLGAIKMSEEYKKALKKYNEARFENNVAKGAVKSIDARKGALENLVRLHGQQYFAGPSVPRDLTKEWQEKEKRKKTSSLVSKKLQRSRT